MTDMVQCACGPLAWLGALQHWKTGCQQHVAVPLGQTDSSQPLAGLTTLDVAACGASRAVIGALQWQATGRGRLLQMLRGPGRDCGSCDACLQALPYVHVL